MQKKKIMNFEHPTLLEEYFRVMEQFTRPLV